MAEIDNLSIRITASADEAARVFDRLASSASRLHTASTGSAGGVRRLGDAAHDTGMKMERAVDESENASKAVKGHGRAAEEAGKAAKRGASGIKVFWESLKRIAFYRFVRSIIRSITDAFKTGITNLYHWSAAVDGTFAKSMDRIATSTLYLKNSLGAMLAPLINTLAPILEFIIDKIVDVINWINKLFSALSGSQTYVVAKKVATTWDDASKKTASSVKKASDEIKRTILGFDEINKLNDNKDNSGGGGYGSGNTTPAYNDMFEERALDGWMAKLAAFIDKFKIGWAGVLGGLLAGFAALKLAVEAVSKLSLGWLKDMAGKVISVGVSLFRKGWSTLVGWVTSFGQSVVELAVRLKTRAVDLWTQLAAQWALLNPVLKVGIVASTTALGLWALYKLAWALGPEKVLAVKLAISNTAAQLKNDIITKWYQLTAWTLGVQLMISTKAAQLKNDIITKWYALVDWALGVKLRIETRAAELKNGFVTAWSNLSEWALGVKLFIATKAAQLKNDVITAWYGLTDWVLGVRLSIETKAAQLKNDIITRWYALNDWALNVKLRLETKASKLKSDISTAWRNLTAWALGVKATVETEASQLKQSIVAAWNGLTTWTLGVFLSISTKAIDLKNKFVREWNSLPDRTLNLFAKIATPLSSLWQWVKDNWVTVALGALGIAIAIATPWSSIAAALSALWADVMASFGGSLAFAVVPTFGYDPVIGAMKEGARGKQKLPDVMGLTPEDLSVNMTVNAVPGQNVTLAEPGYGRNGKLAIAFENGQKVKVDVNAVAPWITYGTTLLKWIGADNLKSTLNVESWTAWQHFGSTLMKWIGADNMRTNVTIEPWTPWWNWQHTSLINYLGLDRLATTITVTATLAGSLANLLFRREKGGIFVGGVWSDIPQYAGGTTNAASHGSMFIAGENGPEIVGHIGGRTEILNKSQIASAMYTAVRSAMSGIKIDADFHNGGVDAENDSMAILLELVQRGADATQRQNELIRQQNDLLRQLNDKEYSTTISTADISRAQARQNRRAGTTIVPVGT